MTILGYLKGKTRVFVMSLNSPSSPLPSLLLLVPHLYHLHPHPPITLSTSPLRQFLVRHAILRGFLRVFLKRPARNPYRKSETQTRRKAFPARATKLASAAGNQQRQWNFPTRIEEFQKPEVEDIFNDFWKTVEDHQVSEDGGIVYH